MIKENQTNMSFSTYYPVDKHPKQILSDGHEEYPPDKERWDLYQRFEAIQKERDEIEEQKSGESSKATPPPRTPQHVIDKLFSARGELDVVLDLISMIEQQQFASVTHVPYTQDPQKVSKDFTLRLQSRKSNLQSTSHRLEKGKEALLKQLDADTIFLDHMKEIGKKWLISKTPHATSLDSSTLSTLGLLTAHAGFYVDLTVPLPVKFKRKIEMLKQHQPMNIDEDPYYQDSCLILPNEKGHACLIHHGTRNISDIRNIPDTKPSPSLIENSQTSLCTGVDAINAELNRLQSIYIWKIINALLLAESEEERWARNDDDGAVAAVLHLSAVVLETEITSKERKEEKEAEEFYPMDDEENTTQYTTATRDDNVQQKQSQGLVAHAISNYIYSKSKSTMAATDHTLSHVYIRKECLNEFISHILRQFAALVHQSRTPYLIRQTLQQEGRRFVATTNQYEEEDDDEYDDTNNSNGGLLAHIVRWIRFASLCNGVSASLTSQRDVALKSSHLKSSVAIDVEEYQISESGKMVRAWKIRVDGIEKGVLVLESCVGFKNELWRWQGIEESSSSSSLLMMPVGRKCVETLIHRVVHSNSNELLL